MNRQFKTWLSSFTDNTFFVLQFTNYHCKFPVNAFHSLCFHPKSLHRLTAWCMPQLTWTVLYTPWGMPSKNLAWWQPDNSIHLIYPLDSTDLPWQSIMLAISFPPGCGGRGRYTRGVQQLASSPWHSWTECACGLGPCQPHVLTLANISWEALTFPYVQ